MPAIVRNVSLTRKRREPETSAKRVPELDKPCPKCVRERGTITMMFHYEGTDSTGKSFGVDICSWHSSEIVEEKKNGR